MHNKSYSKGISWIDDCRIPFVDEKLSRPINDANNDVYGKYKSFGNTIEPQGRFPANLLVCDDMLNDGVITKSNDNIRNNKKSYTIYNQNEINISNTKGFNDKGTNSRYYDIDKWFDNIISE
jgi:hypothetical protein